MKKKFSIINFSLIAAILFSILFQSVHSIEHIATEFTAKKCLHPHDTGKTQLTHEHHNFDHCFTCDFTFNQFVPTEFFSCRLTIAIVAIPYFFTVTDPSHSFSGSSYSLRGPPAFIA